MSTTMTAEPGSAKKNCDCGCGSHDCCELECLVQPRFFCGQLLADQDLTAMVDWVKAKTALARYRDGWGVACGLNVQCGKRGTVTVTPGYALDCCGRDVVVCEEATFDFKDCWKRSDPCANGDLHAAKRLDAAAGAGNPVHFGGLEIDAKDVQVFDLSIRYSESTTDARTALARGGCGGAAGCEYTRVREGHELYCERVADDVCRDPWKAAAGQWHERYTEELRKLMTALERILGLENTKEIPGRLVELLQRYPLRTFCYVREWLCEVQDDPGGVLPAVWRDVAFLIVQDWRNAYFADVCKGCEPGTGVLLARVWVWRRVVEGRERFSTLSIESHAPFRRELRRDELPAPSGFINAASYVWQPAASVEASLRGLGFIIAQSRNVVWDDLKTKLLGSEALYLRPGELVTAYTYTDRCERQRVVYFDNDGPDVAGWLVDRMGPQPAPQPAPPTPAAPTPAAPTPATPPTPAAPFVDTRPPAPVADAAAPEARVAARLKERPKPRRR
jgi:hypothetical protein